MNTGLPIKAAAASLLIVAAGAAAETDLSLARSYDLSHTSSEYSSVLNQSNLADLKLSVQIQARYQFNSRDDEGSTLSSPDDATTLGFSMRRVKFGIEGHVTDTIDGKVKFGFSRGTGNASLEDAYAKWKINDTVTLKIGQFKANILREENMSSSRLLTSERSAMNETYNGDYTQGIEFGFNGDQWRAMVSVNDGKNADNTTFNAAAEADYAISARAEFLLGDASWGQFKQFTSFRGATSGGMIGAAIHYQSGGNTNPVSSAITNSTLATIDFSWVGDGWNFFAAGVLKSEEYVAVGILDDFGVVIQGGFFLDDKNEIFARWDALFPEDSDGTIFDDENFHTFTIGWNHYMIPESHAAKFTVDLSYHLDPTETGLIVPSDGYNLLSDTEGGQIGVTAQMQILF